MSRDSDAVTLEREILDRLRRVLASAEAVPDKKSFLLRRVEGKSVLDLGCVGHSLELSAEQKGDWLHAAVRRAARECLGVDYLEAETEALRRAGWNVVCQDVTRLDLPGRTFEVVVAADVIEHLADHDGFFRSVDRHLAPGGELIVSTPNALGLAHTFYVGLRGQPLVNPTHTCWFDPKTLMQLAGRFGFVPERLAWIPRSWSPARFLLHGAGGFGVADFFTGRWSSAPDGVRWTRAGLQRIAFFPLDLLFRALLRRRYWSGDFVMVLKRG